jgi:molybdenum cofactor sulfurtransferase
VENLIETQEYKTALAQFRQRYPEYATTQALDELRATEYARLDAQGMVYLDYTGGGLYAESQIQKHMALLKANVFGNPHSSNPSSMFSTHLLEEAREAVLKHFNASPDEYVAIFTSNASGALKLVGESFPFSANSRYLLTFDNHNSVNGIREFARARGAQVTYIPICLPELRVDESGIDSFLDQIQPGGHNLFAFPAQSNFSGVQHPLEWIEKAHAKGWTVLLDAAAYVPSNNLDLSRWKPDFVPVSFYKMFGYPTGIGCLIARKEALEILHRPWFAGGTITVASVQGDKYYLAAGEAAFEEGTPNYLGLPAISIGLEHLHSVGMDLIHERVRCLTGWLLEQLVELHDSQGHAGVRIYGPTNTEKRGGTITLNFYDGDDQMIDHRDVEQRTNLANISIRTGCFCNPGAGEVALEISQPELVTCFAQPAERLTLDDFRVCIHGKNSGAVRISVGIASNFADVYRFIQYVKQLFGHSLE